MATLGLAVNVSLGLWFRSTIDAVAYDAARAVASEPDVRNRRLAATEALRTADDLLGERSDRVRLDVESFEPTVRLRVRAEGVDLLPAMIGGGPTVGAIDRTIVVRAESP